MRGAEGQNRTGDTRIFSPLLYRLSYLGEGQNNPPPQRGMPNLSEVRGSPSTSGALFVPQARGTIGSGPGRSRDLVNVQLAPVPWGLRDVILALVAALVLVLVVVGGALGGLFVFRTIVDVSPFARPVSIAAIAIYQIGFLGIALVIARRRGGLAALGFRAFPPAALLAVATLLFLGLLVQIAYGLLLQSLGIGQENPQRIDLLVGATPVSLAIALLSGAVLAPIAEETFFRGLVLTGLIARLGVTGAVAVSSALFAAAHLVPQVIPPIFILGVLLAILRLWSGSLWPPIALHAAFNAISLLAVFAVAQTTAA
ncbi:MAG: hypothetical protein KatS3mg060_0662 [Dehalococcoidia bacterium]|nr:MAG: hypothetical protein KatS3mg060_0662 [Dehalococcoidia bacterium]